MKKLIALILAMLMAFSLVACGGGESGNDGEKVVKIGVYEPQTGDNGAGGKQEILGMQYGNYVQPTVEINGETYQVKLEIVDNRTTAENGPSAASELVNRKVSIVLGSYGSGVSAAGAKVFNEANVAAIGVTCTNPIVTAGNPAYFRICFTDPFQGPALASYAKDGLGVSKAYTLAMLGSDYDQGLVKFFTPAFEKLGGSVKSEDFPEGTANFVSYINNAKDAGAGVIFAPVSINYAQLIIEAAASQGYEGVILGSDTWDSNKVAEATVGKDVTVAVTTFYQEGADAEFDAGIKEWINSDADAKANNGGNDQVSAVTVMGYDAYFVALEALKKAGTTDAAKVLEVLPSVTHEGVCGKVVFGAEGDAVRDMAVIKQANPETGAWDFVKIQQVG